MKISKCLTVGVILFLLGIVGLQASDTRTQTLGYATNFYVQDDYNIWYFPSTLVNYRSMVIAESEYGMGYGDSELWSGGVHIPVSSDFTLGVYLLNTKYPIDHADTRFTDPFGGIYIDRKDIYPNLDSNEASHQFTVIGALRMTNMDLGLTVSSFSSKLTYTDPNNSDNNFEDRLSTIAAAGGLSFKPNEKTRFDGTVFYNTSSFRHVEYPTYRDTVQYRQPYGYSTYGLDARLFYVLNTKTILVPFLRYMSSGQGYQWLVKSITTTDGITTMKDKQTSYFLGMAADLIPFSNNMVTLAAGLYNYTETYAMTLLEGTPDVPDKYTWRALPFLSIGLESKLIKWLDVRFSFYELLETSIYEEAVTETILDKGRLTGSSYAANFGLAFHVGRFDIDTLIDTDGAADFLHNGPYILSGKEYYGLFSKISIKYNFK
ncbi:hypothetical protein MUP95_05355 [bacterium]|nr:hypothetical protein [bacterium]